MLDRHLNTFRIIPQIIIPKELKKTEGEIFPGADYFCSPRLPNRAAISKQEISTSTMTAEQFEEHVKKRQRIWGNSNVLAANILEAAIESKNTRTRNLPALCFELLSPLRFNIANHMKQYSDMGTARIIIKNGEYIESHAHTLGGCRVDLITPLDSKNNPEEADYCYQYSYVKEELLKKAALKRGENFEVFSYTCSHKDPENNAFEAVVTELDTWTKGIDEKGNEINLPHGPLILLQSTIPIDMGSVPTIRKGTEFIRKMHMREEHILPSLKYADQIYQKILTWKKGDDIRNLVYWTALVQWYLLMVMPFLGGNAAIGDLFVYVSLKRAGIVPKRIPGDVLADFMTFTSTPEEFAENECVRYLGSKEESKEKKKEEKITEEKTDRVNLNCQPFLRDKYYNSGYYALASHPGIPYPERCPNLFRAGIDRTIINLQGRSSHEKYLDRLEKQFKHFLNKIESNSEFKSDSSSKVKIKFLTINKRAVFAFMYIWPKFLLRYDTLFLDSSESIKKTIKETSLSDLRNAYNNYIQSESLLDWLDKLSYEEQESIYNSESLTSERGSGLLTPEDIIKLDKIRILKQTPESEISSSSSSTVPMEPKKVFAPGSSTHFGETNKTTSAKEEKKLGPTSSI